MTTLAITAKVSRSSAANDASVDVSGVTPTNNWTLFLKVWSFGSVNTQRARISFQDSVDAFTNNVTGPTRCIVPVNNVPEGRIYSWRWRDYDDLRIGTASAVLRTALTRITGGTIVYEAWLTY